MRRLLTPLLLILAAATPALGANAHVYAGAPVRDPAASATVALNVRVEGRTEHICGGVRVGPRLVLTARHCAASENPNAMRVGGVPGRQERADTQARVRSVDLPPLGGLDPEVGLPDVALLHLARAVPGPIAVVDATGAAAVPGREAQVEGWGLRTHMPWSGPRRLFAGTVHVVGTDACAGMFPGWAVQVHPTYDLCAGGMAERVDSCQGDSGGPLYVAPRRVAGIVSRGRRCGDPRSPGVYANLAPLAQWLGERGVPVIEAEADVPMPEVALAPAPEGAGTIVTPLAGTDGIEITRLSSTRRAGAYERRRIGGPVSLPAPGDAATLCVTPYSTRAVGTQVCVTGGVAYPSPG